MVKKRKVIIEDIREQVRKMKADIQGGGDDKRQRGLEDRQEAPDTRGAASSNSAGLGSSGDAAVSAAAPLRGPDRDHKRRAEDELEGEERKAPQDQLDRKVRNRERAEAIHY